MMRNWKRLFMLMFTGLAAIPACGRADDSAPRVQEFRYWGNGCPDGSADGHVTETLDFEILLTDFSAATSAQVASAGTKCDFRLKLALPKGKKLRIAETFVQGFARIAPHGGRGVVRTSYNFAGMPREKWEWALPTQNGQLQDFSFQGSPELFAWPGCGKPVEIVGSVAAQAVRGTDGQNSEIYIQNQIGRQSRMLWDWEMIDCSPADDVTALDGHWHSRYTTERGALIQSEMEIAGAEGWYTLPGPDGRPQKGKIFNVISTGDTIFARWRVANTEGWLKVQVSGSTFQGQWGFGEADSPAKGTWEGHR